MAGSRIACYSIAAAAVLLAVYAVYANFINDPSAEQFLSHKTDLKRALNVSAWLTVMRVHVVFACLSMITGAINFFPAVYARHRKLHRVNGYVYVVSVMLVVLTSGYMAPYSTGGKATSVPLNMLSILWAANTVLAIIKIKKKQVNAHRHWMIRSYVFVFTNFVIHRLTNLLHDAGGLSYIASYTTAVYSTIVLLLLAAELIVRSRWLRKTPRIAN